MFKITVFLLVTLHALHCESGVGANDPIKHLAKQVYNKIISRSDKADKKGGKISYLYLHGCSDYNMPQTYGNQDVDDIIIFKKGKIPALRTGWKKYFPPCDEKSKLFIGTAEYAKQILPQDHRFDCPHLAILGRGKFAAPAIDVDGWPKGPGGFIEWKKKAAQRCPGTKFYYYIYQRKPKAELVIEQFEKDHVNVFHRSDFL